MALATDTMDMRRERARTSAWNLDRILATTDELHLTVMRVGLGVVMFPHGAQKVLGWFGGGGPAGTIAGFQQMGIPAFITVLVMMAEFLGSLGLIVGLGTRVAAAGIAVVMLGAIYKVHLGVGFFMNWTGNLQGEGYEFHILALALAIALILKGAGRYSIDRALTYRRE